MLNNEFVWVQKANNELNWRVIDDNDLVRRPVDDGAGFSGGTFLGGPFLD